jgi:hypothetical protein
MIICEPLSDCLLYSLVCLLIISSKLSQAIKHDTAKVKDIIIGKEIYPSFIVILVMQMLNLYLRPREPEYFKLDNPSEFSYQAE